MAPAPATTHVLLVTFNSQGHINPFLRFAKRLAANGTLVTFASTADVAHKIRAAANDSSAASPDPIPVGRGHLRFEFFSDEWEFDDPRRKDLSQYMPQLMAAGTVAVGDLIRRQPDIGLPPVDCVIGNLFIPWVLDVAAEMGIPSGVLWCQSAAVFSAYYHYYYGLVEFPTAERPEACVSLPGMPVLYPHEVPSYIRPDSFYPAITAAIMAQFGNLSKARWVLVYSADELEKDVIAGISHLARLIPVGPLVDSPGISSETSEANTIRANLLEVATECVEWLDGHQPLSVVYVSVGSVVSMTEDEMAEMAWGLVSSRRPFLWVVRKDVRHLIPDGFAAAAREQGMVVGWCPQEGVLSHPAVGCFLTHCGWNSTLECLAHGVPAVTFPYWGDQPTNAKFLVDIWGVGVRIRESRVAEFTREGLREAVEEVMTEGPRAEEIRRNASRWKEEVRAALAEGGSSERATRAFLEELQGLMRDRKEAGQ